MQKDLPAITGFQLIHILKSFGFVEHRKAKHGLSLTKKGVDRTIVTIVPNTNKSLPISTLMQILGPKQTKIGRKGLLQLIDKYGL